jgi:hypothetical protein
MKAIMLVHDARTKYQAIRNLFHAHCYRWKHKRHGDETLVASTVVLHSFDRMQQESTNKQCVACTALHYMCTYQFYSTEHEKVARKLTLFYPLLPEAAAVALTCAPVGLACMLPQSSSSVVTSLATPTKQAMHPLGTFLHRTLSLPSP